MPRTIGALNRPKYIKVKLSDINNIFKPDAEIEISIGYSNIFGYEKLNNCFSLRTDEVSGENKEEKIEFTIR